MTALNTSAAKHFQISQTLLSDGDVFGAYAQATQGYYLVKPAGVFPIADKLTALRPNSETLAILETELRAYVAKIDRVLSIGEVYNADETLMLLSKRETAGAILSFLADAYSIALDVDLSEIDTLIRRKLPRYFDKPSRHLYARIYE